MRVVHVNTADRGGGAERVALDLCRVTRQAGHDARLLVGHRLGPLEEGVLSLEDAAGRWRRFWTRRAARARRPAAARLLRVLSAPRGALERMLGREDFDHPASRRIASWLVPWPDVFHLHNLHGGYFDLRILPELGRRAAVFATLHDPWMLTGHCAHPFECPRWKRGCGSCPDLDIYPPVRRDATAFNWRRKRAIYARSRLHLAAPSRWLMDMVERSMLEPAAVETRVIPNGIDLAVFHPGDRARARAALGLPGDGRMVLLVGGRSRGAFRDSAALLGALDRAASRLSAPPRFVALGDLAPAAPPPRVPLHRLPYASDPGEVARAFQAADLFVHATRADTFPGVVLEAGACGIAVVASAVGGIPEQIEDGRTGQLVPPGDPDRLARAIETLVEDDARRSALGAAAARRVAERHDLVRVTRAYLDWYAAVLGDRARNAGGRSAR